ncbi:MAG TPA: hypothetical protein PK874_11025 [Desulfobacteraceae bacterium]|nr:hypothetical protein [Desulfobacteraceae bacterium]HPJ67897.1 hypothetical protein [Desulfobacteraceae bacterium]HPQ29909.1 hypothetical protein [Desulfobacteraceae bacterium]
MKITKSAIFKSIIIFIFCLIAFLNDSYSDDSQYPIKVEVIDKQQARYDTPENAFIALHSALKKADLEWSDQTLTKKSAEEQRILFKEAGIDPRKIFEIEKNVKDVFIIKKVAYKDVVLLKIKHIVKDGSTRDIPATFIIEDGKWKSTNKYGSDEALHEYLDYTPPPTLTANVKIQPKIWSIDLYNWIKENLETSRLAQFLAEKLTILCIIKDIKDKDGNFYNVNDTILESICLNGIVPPQTWKVMGMEKTAIVQDSELNEKLKLKRGFDEWNRNESFIKNTRMPFILVRFNMFKSMGTLPDMKPNKKYDIEITGKLNDENEKVFKGTAKIKLMGIKNLYKKELEKVILPKAEQDLPNWWNQEPGLDDRWKSLRHDKPDKYNDS